MCALPCSRPHCFTHAAKWEVAGAKRIPPYVGWNGSWQASRIVGVANWISPCSTLYCMPQGINRRSYHEKAVEYMSKFPAPADDDTMRRFFGAEVRCVPSMSATCAWTLIGSMVACTGAAWSAVFLHHGQLLPRVRSSWRVDGGSPFAAAASRLHVRLPAAAARL